MTLPPGQRAVPGLPRFGVDTGRPPEVPDRPTLDLTGPALSRSVRLALDDLADLPRRRVTADLHCVSGWSATGLVWEGVTVADVLERWTGDLVDPDAPPTHAVFRGLDGYQSVALLEDVRGDDVLLADRLDGEPLGPSHGAPLRLVSPGQYGFVSTKHLCRIELHVGDPHVPYHRDRRRHLMLQVVKPHPRARVWREERHRYLPSRVVRPLYRGLITVGPLAAALRAGVRADARREQRPPAR